MPNFIDLSHTIEHGMITYKGLPAPLICDFLSRKESRRHYTADTEFQIGKIELVSNTGTYLDTPFHRYATGQDLAQLKLKAMANLDGIVLRAKGQRAIDATRFAGVKFKGRAVLVHTGWDHHWRTPRYFEGHPFLTRDAAQSLLDGGATLVGIDSYNIDDTSDLTRPVHSLLLGSGIPIVEHMCQLEQLPKRGFKFFAVPPKIKGMGTFPVRAFAIVNV